MRTLQRGGGEAKLGKDSALSDVDKTLRSLSSRALASIPENRQMENNNGTDTSSEVVAAPLSNIYSLIEALLLQESSADEELLRQRNTNSTDEPPRCDLHPTSSSTSIASAALSGVSSADDVHDNETVEQSRKDPRRAIRSPPFEDRIGEHCHQEIDAVSGSFCNRQRQTNRRCHQQSGRVGPGLGRIPEAFFSR
jgi:hypothetical protein